MGQSETAKVLLDNGAEPNQADENAEIDSALTRFRVAAIEGDVKEIRRLLKNGKNPNLADGYGETALMAAAADGHSEIVTTFARQRRRLRIMATKRFSLSIMASEPNPNLRKQNRLDGF